MKNFVFFLIKIFFLCIYVTVQGKDTLLIKKYGHLERVYLQSGDEFFAEPLLAGAFRTYPKVIKCTDSCIVLHEHLINEIDLVHEDTMTIREIAKKQYREIIFVGWSTGYCRMQGNEKITIQLALTSTKETFEHPPQQSGMMTTSQKTPPKTFKKKTITTVKKVSREVLNIHREVLLEDSILKMLKDFYPLVDSLIKSTPKQQEYRLWMYTRTEEDVILSVEEMKREKVSDQQKFKETVHYLYNLLKTKIPRYREGKY